MENPSVSAGKERGTRIGNIKGVSRATIGHEALGHSRMWYWVSSLLQYRAEE